MLLEDDITEMATRICDQLASAVERYAAISGLGLDYIPEGYLRDSVFDGLGDVLTMTLETNNRTLWEWNHNAKSSTSPVPTQPLEFKNQTRPDLVIYKGDYTKKDETKLFCLVEIKKWWSEDPNDLIKIKNWFRWLDTCRFGMLCAFIDVSNEQYIEKLRIKAEYAGDQWCSGRIARSRGIEKNYQAFARIIEQKL